MLTSGSVVRRREVIAGLSGPLVSPRFARAQKPTIPVIGYLNRASSAQFTHLLAAFRNGLDEMGYVSESDPTALCTSRRQLRTLPMASPKLSRSAACH